jgi:hypothetical protein
MMACTTRATIVAKSKYFLTWLAIATAALGPVAPASAGTDSRWPQIPLPKHVDVFKVGNEMVVNGMPIRVQGFVSRATPAELAASMRQLLGSPLMEDRRGGTLVLGRGEGQYYITVQLSPLGSGTRALIAVTKPPVSTQPTDAPIDRHLLSAFPPGSTLTSHTSSIDDTAHADYAAIVNSHSGDINAEHVKRMMHADGFTLEREAKPKQGSRPGVNASPGARTMFFKRAGAEAVAVVARNQSGDSVIVLNRVSFTERAK